MSNPLPIKDQILAAQPRDSGIEVLADEKDDVKLTLPPAGLNRFTLLLLAMGVPFVILCWRGAAEFVGLIPVVQDRFVSGKSSVKLFALGVVMLLLGILFAIARQRIILRPTGFVKQLRVFGIPLFWTNTAWNAVKSMHADTSGGLPVIQLRCSDIKEPVSLDGFFSLEERDWVLSSVERYRESVSRPDDTSTK